MDKKRRKSLLAIDIGNTTLTYGIFQGERLVGTGYATNSAIPKMVKKLGLSGRNNIYSSVIISSVVPNLTSKLLKYIGRNGIRSSVYLLGKDIVPKLPMKYQRKALGQDRLVNLFGAHKRFGGPILVVDFGTAITFDYLDRKGIFQGGLIVPGVETSFRALLSQAALLPKSAKINEAKELVGRDTRSAMSSGILNGFGALADGLIERFKACYGRNLKVLATGGFSKKIARYSRHIDYVDPLHTIKSLAMIYQHEIGGKIR
ncbi:MAG: type III pantothenate kinase [Candidatus Omnitrophica bacterium]|nr:type III pantothenate kinase [Candidatus Omnitrophota bacterium]